MRKGGIEEGGRKVGLVNSTDRHGMAAWQY